MDTVTSNSVTYKIINRRERVKMLERYMQLVKINGSGPGWRRKM